MMGRLIVNILKQLLRSENNNTTPPSHVVK